MIKAKTKEEILDNILQKYRNHPRIVNIKLKLPVDTDMTMLGGTKTRFKIHDPLNVPSFPKAEGPFRTISHSWMLGMFDLFSFTFLIQSVPKEETIFTKTALAYFLCAHLIKRC